jgi:hypothetical protein
MIHRVRAVRGWTRPISSTLRIRARGTRFTVNQREWSIESIASDPDGRFGKRKDNHRIRFLDRVKLRALACECYQVTDDILRRFREARLGPDRDPAFASNGKGMQGRI